MRVNLPDRCGKKREYLLFSIMEMFCSKDWYFLKGYSSMVMLVEGLKVYVGFMRLFPLYEVD
jgi:hypothetical protein